MLSLSKYLFCYSTLIEFLMVLLSRKEREFNLLELGLANIPPNYNDKDLIHFKIGTLHNTKKFLFNKKIVRKM